MKPLLFLGSEYLRRMTDSTNEFSDREGYGAFLDAYLGREEGHALRSQLVNAFNALDREELRVQPPDVLLWYLDWVSGSDQTVLRAVDIRFLELLWFAVQDDLLRTRDVEVILLVEETAECPATESAIPGIVTHLLPSTDTATESVWPESRLVRDVVDTLLTEQSDHALRVLGRCIRVLPQHVRGGFLARVRARSEQLGPENAQRIMHLVQPASDE